MKLRYKKAEANGDLGKPLHNERGLTEEPVLVGLHALCMSKQKISSHVSLALVWTWVLTMRSN